MNGRFACVNLQILDLDLWISGKIHAGEFLGRDAKAFLELTGEMTVLFIAKQECDFLHRILSVEQVLCVVQSQLVEPIAKLQTANVAKVPLELAMGNTEIGGERFGGEQRSSRRMRPVCDDV